MPRTQNSSSSPAPAERLLRVPLDRLHPHPLNANVMAPERRAALRRNLEREDRYPPLVARPHPDRAGHWQLLDGHQRWLVLREMGRNEAQVFPWPCDNATALVLLATLNRLEGDDVPARRADLLAALQESFALQDLRRCCRRMHRRSRSWRRCATWMWTPCWPISRPPPPAAMPTVPGC